MPHLSDTELVELFSEQLPGLLDRHPELEYRLYTAFLRTFTHKEEFSAVLAELRNFRFETYQRFEQVDLRLDDFQTETRQRFEQVDQRFEQVDQRFEQVDQRFEQVDQRFDQVDQRFDQVDQRFDQVDQRLDRVEAGIQELHRAIDRLGARWGIRNESLFRETITALLEDSFGAQVESRVIAGEQFDLIIFDQQHILVEIEASTGPGIQERLERKRRLYTEAAGVVPTRVILATASIHSRRAQQLRDAGFEVIEPAE